MVRLLFFVVVVTGSLHQERERLVTERKLKMFDARDASGCVKVLVIEIYFPHLLKTRLHSKKHNNEIGRKSHVTIKRQPERKGMANTRIFESEKIEKSKPN